MLGTRGASLSLSGRLLLSNMVGTRHVQKMNVRQDISIWEITGLAKMFTCVGVSLLVKPTDSC